MVLKHYKCPTVIVLPPCNWLFELDFRLCGCAGIRLWGLFILASNRKAIWLFSKLAIHWSMLFRPCVHSSFCLLLPSFRVVQSSSPFLLVKRFVQFFHGHKLKSYIKTSEEISQCFNISATML